MKKKNVLLFLLLSFIILNTVLLIYLANFRLVVYNDGFYKKEFVKNNVYGNVPDANNELKELFLFFNEKGSLDDNFFTSDEISHLEDVRILISKAIILFYISIFLEILFIVLLYKKRKYIKFILLYSGGSVLLVSVLFYLFSNNFGFLFIKFHEMFFPQGNWMFPVGSNLILLFPQQFFYDVFYKITINSFIISIIVFAAGLLLFSDEK